MTKDELAPLLHQIIDEHKSDKDGGYAVVADVSDVYSGLGDADQAQLREYLLDKIGQQAPKLWGIGLEVLTRHGNKEIGRRLEVFARSTQDREYKEQLILAMLRMGYDALDLYLPHIESLFADGRLDCPKLAHLYRVSPQHSLEMSASYFAQQLSGNAETRGIEGCVQIFVYNYPNEDERSLAKLVAATRRLDASAAERLRALIVDDLGKPWVGRELGDEKRSRVLAHILSDPDPGSQP